MLNFFTEIKITRWMLLLLLAVFTLNCPGSSETSVLPLPGGSSDAPMTDAEVAAELAAVATLAETGYGKSVFENPDNKCQHCHYDTHDNWKNSQHGNSWNNPVFQSKFQQYLRSLMGKIGGSLTTASAASNGKICLNCHAPAAMYSNDISLTFTQQTGTNSNNISSDTTTDVSRPVVMAGKGSDNATDYTVSYHVGNATNRAGISCSYCHSIEKIHMQTTGDSYISMASLPGGSPAAGTTFNYSADPANVAMTQYYSIVGPVIYSDYLNKGSVTSNPGGRTKDGRYDMKAINVTTGADTPYYAGGPYYGPYGNTGLTNDHPNDQTADRSALVAGDNSQFGTRSKTLCFGCHQRSAGSANPVGTSNDPGQADDIAGDKMELCISAHVADDRELATSSSPNCTTCHMEKRKGIVLNHWKRETLPNKTDPTLTAGMTALLNAGTYSSHAWEASNSPGKLSAAISATMTRSGNTATVTLTNETPHSFPEAHPMRRALLMVRAFDAAGNEIAATTAVGSSQKIATVFNYVSSYTASPVAVSIALHIDSLIDNIIGLIADLTGTPEAVYNQRFGNGGSATLVGTNGVTLTDVTLKKRICEDRALAPNLTATAYNSGFVRIYGREILANTGVSNLFNLLPTSEGTGEVVDGFLGNTSLDNRLNPNEKETYTVTFASTPATVEYRVYYLKFGPRLSTTATVKTGYPTADPNFVGPNGTNTGGWPLDGWSGVTLISTIVK